MARTGFTLQQLRLAGDQVADAIIRLEVGLNVITGASDTGKSHIFRCIDFMLGSSTVPKSIPEAVGYLACYLQLAQRVGGVHTLRRAMTGGRFEVYDGEIDGLDLLSAGRILAEAHSQDSNENISQFLLSISGFPSARLRKNQQNETQSLSFRNIAQLIRADETKIISEVSPVLSGQSVNATAERSTFEFLLTGVDASSLIATGDIRTRKTSWLAQVQVFNRLIHSLEVEIAASNSQIGNQQEYAVIEETTSILSRRIRNEVDRIDRANRLRERAREHYVKLDSRRIALEELISRFELLREHYHTDLSRLEFIVEGDFLVTQLMSTGCPLCGTVATNEEAFDAARNSSAIEPNLKMACSQEQQKIRAHLNDLESTITELRSEHAAISSSGSSQAARVQMLSNYIKNHLEPSLNLLRKDWAALIAQRDALQELDFKRKRRDELIVARFQLGPEPRRQRTEVVSQSTSIDDALRDFGAVVLELLRSWEYPANSISFSDSYDLIIDGRPRQDHGKGVRAVLKSAFIIGLMKFCISTDRPHPGFVILDSPLTTFKEASRQTTSSNEDISLGIQEAFFGNLSDIGEDMQVIILENKEPPASIKRKISYTEFSGKVDVGRQGFIPLSATPRSSAV